MYRPRITPANHTQALDDLVTRNVLSTLTAAVPKMAPQAAAQSSQDLVPDLVHKLLALETENTTLKQQVQELQQQAPPQQHQHHKQCSEEYQHQLQQQEKQMQHLQSEVQRLRQQCKAAWQQVADVKQFLNDYGLIWVGDSNHQCMQEQAGTLQSAENPSSSHQTNPKAAAAVTGCASLTGLPFDIAELQECLDELNLLVRDGIAQLKQTGSTCSSTVASKVQAAACNRGCKAFGLCIPDAVKLAIYKDGLQLHKSPAVLYSSETADIILSDIYDGYFPSVLKPEFPDGTPIHLVDKTNMTIAEAVAVAAALRGSNVRSIDDINFEQHLPPAPMDGDMLISSLPKVVIKNQQVVPVQAAVAHYLNGNASNVGRGSMSGRVYIRPNSSSRNGSIAGTAVPQQGATNTADAVAISGNAVEAQQQKQCTTVQVKSEDGRQTYVIKLPYTATVANLRSSIDSHRNSSGYVCHVCKQRMASMNAQSIDAVDTGCCYELRSAFPTRLYADDGSTLEAAGLTPSATLFMRHC